MKELKYYINEAFKINKNIKLKKYNFFPKTRKELIDIIKQRIADEGNECDLNDIDVSEITNMSYLFCEIKEFDGDISKWDVSNVKEMRSMFWNSMFNQDISKWDVSNVTDMNSMFSQSNFTGDISKWDVSNVKDMGSMFTISKFNNDISDWDVSNVTDYDRIFDNCPIEEKYKPKFK